MAQIEHAYNELEESIENDKITYYFVSNGDSDIIKAIQYQYIQELIGKPVFNLGFGDYDIENDKINDLSESNNGDPRRVFNTVLNSIPNFFLKVPNSMTLVTGSDSKKEYSNKCKEDCKKRCEDNICKNAHRRITIYRNYVNNNFASLSVDYEFFGGVIQDGNTLLENYIVGKDYKSVSFYKK